DVDVKVVVAVVLAHDLAFIDCLARPHEEHAARLQVIDGIGGRLPRPVGYEGAVGAMRNLTLPLRVAVEERVEKAVAAGGAVDVGAVPDEAARGEPILETYAPRAVIDHPGHQALAGSELLGDGADELLGDVHHEMLHGLERLALLLPRDDLGLA